MYCHINSPREQPMNSLCNTKWLEIYLYCILQEETNQLLQSKLTGTDVNKVLGQGRKANKLFWVAGCIKCC